MGQSVFCIPITMRDSPSLPHPQFLLTIGGALGGCLQPWRSHPEESLHHHCFVPGSPWWGKGLLRGCLTTGAIWYKEHRAGQRMPFGEWGQVSLPTWALDSLYLFFPFFNWSIVNLQYYIIFQYTAKWFRSIYVYVCVCVCVYIYNTFTRCCCLVAQSCPTLLWPHGL